MAVLAAGVVPVDRVALDDRFLGGADDHAAVEGVALAARDRRGALAVGVGPAQPIAAVHQLRVDRPVAGHLVLLVGDLLGAHVQRSHQADVEVVVAERRQVVVLGPQCAVAAPGYRVVPAGRLQHRARLLPGTLERRTLRVADDAAIVAVAAALDGVGAVHPVAGIPGDVEGALVAARGHRLQVVAVVPADAVGRGEQEDALVAAAVADRLVAFPGVRLGAVDEHRGAVQVPHDVVVGAAVEGEDAEIGLDPVQAVVALRVQGEVAAVVVLQRPAVAVMGHAVAVEGAFVGARDVQARDLVVARRDAPVRAHAAHVPHAVLAHQFVVQHGPVEVDALAHAGAAVLPRPVAVRRHQHRALDPDLHLAADAALLPDQRLVQQQNRGCRPRGVFVAHHCYRARDGVRSAVAGSVAAPLPATAIQGR